MTTVNELEKINHNEEYVFNEHGKKIQVLFKKQGVYMIQDMFLTIRKVGEYYQDGKGTKYFFTKKEYKAYIKSLN